MATAQSIIDSARYDLGDYETGIMWDDTELLNYLNRMIGVMNSQLVALESELVEEEELDIDCVEDQAYVDISGLNSGLYQNILRVWIDQDLIEQISLTSMRYKRIFRVDQSARPYYWCLKGDLILFEQDCADSYDELKIYYNTKEAAMALDDSMPYDDRFNETFREVMVLYSMAKKDGNASGISSMMTKLFQKRAMEETISRTFIPKPYYIDF
jgi:hypothetical protein